MASIIIPRPKLIVPGHISMQGKVAAYIRIEKAKCDSEGNELEGTRHVVAPWFKNTITDIGLDAKGTGWTLRCVLGTGTLPITNSSEELNSRIGVHDSKIGDGFFAGSPAGIVTASTPYYGWKRGTYRFNAGNSTGTLGEVGLTIADGVNYRIAMGSLIKDNVGNPVTITKQADELLDISYEVRMYCKMTDDTYIVNINGTDHTFTTRAHFDTVDHWGHMIPAGAPQNFGNYQTYGASDSVYTGATLANIGTILQPLQGTTFLGALYQGDGNTRSYTPYVPSTLFREVNFSIGPSNYVTALGITGLSITTSVGQYKTVVSPAIPKTLGSTVSLKARWYWDRYIM